MSKSIPNVDWANQLANSARHCSPELALVKYTSLYRNN
ncbi:hypothetical protein HMPREF1015_03208 [Bacillus smithii 7_3_47FAA]|uniref:Uncharacterized protein n=1 Tax=Bacillus smithii 7_3_47FAA TaxID=665952 RepID=G9QKE5_9BACI|nr:hypothetical protein HMPREF1015_03208 [Bacillus smithii 7_3_47FAA]